MIAATPGLFRTPGTLGATQSGPPLRTLVLPWAFTGAVLGVFGTGAGLIGPDDVAALQVRVLDVGTHPAWERIATPTVMSELGAAIRALQRRSGLTWGQFAEALGVSRRAVHHWVAGRRLSAQHARQIEALTTLVSEFEGLTSNETRARLLVPGMDGRSALARFRELSQPRRTMPLSTLSVSDFLTGDLEQAPALPPPARRSRVAPRRLGGSGTAAADR